MALDLTPLRPKLNELILVDRCTIYRDSEGNRDDTVDPATGSIVSGADETVVLANARCKVRYVLRDSTRTEAGVPNVVSQFDVSVPGGGPVVHSGDWVKILASPHDPSLVGQILRVEEIRHSSLGIFSKYRCELRERQYDRP